LTGAPDKADSVPPAQPPAGPADLAPRGPWSFMASACAGGCSRWGLQLTAAWVAFSLLSNVLWALHLSRLTGWSSLPNYWGELLTARDLMELLENGGLRAHWTGPWVPLAAGLAMCWVLWSGWRLQAAAAGLPARFGPWVWGLADALAIGAPLAALAGLLLLALGGLAGTGIQGFGWCQWVGGSLVRLAFWSALFLQWWLCRLGRAGAPPGPRLGSWRALFRHLGVSFRRFWLHPLQWLSLVLGGVALRTGLTLLALALAWRLGGGTIPKVCGLLAMELAVVAVDAWLLGWFLRLAALFLRHDAAVRALIDQLRAQAATAEAP